MTRLKELQEYPYRACGPDVVMLLKRLDEAKTLIKNFTSSGLVKGCAPNLKVEVSMTAYAEAVQWVTSLE